MNILFDISQTGSGKAGCGYYSHALIHSLLKIDTSNKYTLLPDFGSFYFDPSMPLFNPYSQSNVLYGPRHLSSQSAKHYWSQSDLESILKFPDIIHSNNFWCPTQLRSSRLFYTLYDLSFLANPDWTTEVNRIGCFEGLFRSSIKADWIIAISQSSCDHFLKMYPHFPKERIRVIYPSSRFTNSSLKGVPLKERENIIPRKFWLSVGTIEPRKNYVRLIETYARYLTISKINLPLVIAGGNGWLMHDFQRRLENLGIQSMVIMLGYVEDEQLIWLYRNCYANLYPSLFEGFGLPILEGMQFGAPTLASNTTSIPEVTGDAAILLNPYEIDEWSQAMIRIEEKIGMRNNLIEASLSQARKFSWNSSASALLELYRESMTLPKRLIKE